MPSPQPSESALCRSCGLCCSGVIFRSVPLAPAEDVAALMAAGIAVESTDGGRRFAQPCPAHDGEGCRVYADRPAACRHYRCDLMRRCAEGGIDRAAALGVIGEALRLNRQLAQAVRELDPGDRGRRSRAALLKQFSERLEQSREPEMKRKLGAVVVQILALDGFIRRNFGSSVLDWSEPKP